MAKRKTRQRAPVRPAWEDETEYPTVDEDSERQSPEYRALVGRIMLRSRGKCEAMMGCGRAPGIDPHHVYPVSEGGPVVVPDDWLLFVCRQCHGKIHGNERPEAERRRLIVPKRRKAL